MKIDLTLGTRPARMRPSKMSEDVVLDFSGVPTAADILAKYQPTDKPNIYSRTTAGETHPVGDIFAPGTNHPPRQTLLKNPLLDDPYLSRGDRAYAALHTINRTDCYAGTEAESDAVFSGGGIRKHVQRQDTPKTYDGNLSEETLTEALAQNIVDLIEAYPGVSIGEIFNGFFVVQEHPDLSLGQVLEAFRDQFRESHVQLIVEQLRDLKATVAKAKLKIGTSKNLRSNQPKHEQPRQKFDAVSGSAGHAIAVASSNVVGGRKKKQPDGISGSVNESTTRYLTGRLPGF